MHHLFILESDFASDQLHFPTDQCEPHSSQDTLRGPHAVLSVAELLSCSFVPFPLAPDSERIAGTAQ